MDGVQRISRMLGAPRCLWICCCSAPSGKASINNQLTTQENDAAKRALQTAHQPSTITVRVKPAIQTEDTGGEHEGAPARRKRRARGA